MNRTFDEQMQDIGRREYGLHHALAGPFRKENGSAGIPVSNSRGQSLADTLSKKSCTYNPESDFGYKPCRNGVGSDDKYDDYHDGYYEAVLHSILRDLNNEDCMAFLVAAKLILEACSSSKSAPRPP